MKLDANLSEEELKVFLAEADEQIELLDSDIITLEKEGANPDLLQEIFRAAHTLKGSSAMVGHQRMAELTHAMESLLDKLRNGELSVNTEIVDALLHSLDALKVLKNEIVSAEDSGLDITPLVIELKAATGQSAGPAKVAKKALTLGPDAREKLQEAVTKGQEAYNIKVALSQESEWAAVRCLQIVTELARIGEVIGSAPTAAEIEGEGEIGFDLEVVFVSPEDKDTIEGIITSIADIVSAEVTTYDAEKEAAAQGARTAEKKVTQEKKAAQAESSQSFQTVRIDVQILDNLMNIVEELVIDRSRISRIGKILGERYTNDEFISELGETSNHIIKIINELQESIMKVRMVPIATIFNRFPRMVRDLAQTQQKQLDFIVEGEETELDRSIIEQIRDPLIHLLRNAVDHGIEPSEKRKAAHKPEKATIRLAASHEQSHIVITLEDDGGGIDPEKVKNSAIKKGVIPAGAAEKLTEAEAIDLIFGAGMSTAEKATEVSGRGVGLDIVKTNVESLSGSVDLATRVGQGTKFTIRLPLTVAIIQGLMLTSDGVIYILPLTSVLETMIVTPAEIKTIGRKEVINRRGSIIPLLRLNTALGQETREIETNGKGSLVVVVKADDKSAGLIVDGLMERQEIVVKSLGEYLGDIEGIAGATILGDGKVALILDVASLIKMAIQESAGNRNPEPQAKQTPSFATA